mgnify:CR=1 FL=1
MSYQVSEADLKTIRLNEQCDLVRVHPRVLRQRVVVVPVVNGVPDRTAPLPVFQRPHGLFGYLRVVDITGVFEKMTYQVSEADLKTIRLNEQDTNLYCVFLLNGSHRPFTCSPVR